MAAGRRLTFDSAADMACGWTPDGKHVLFASSRDATFPTNYGLYTVPVGGGAERRLVTEAKEGTFAPSGDRLAYVRGPGAWYRKGYRGSSNDDIWVCNADGTGHRRITSFNGQDHSPMWSADGATLTFVSEQNGPANLFRLPANAPAGTKATPITNHTDDGVRRARLSRDGSTIVYECGADLYVVSAHDGGTPRKLAIEVHADDKANNDRVTTFTRGATEFTLSPDEKHMIFAVQGKLFRQKVGSDARVQQLTDGPSNDHGAAWSPDGEKVLFLSDRGGHEDVYLLQPNDPEHPKFVDAHRFKVTQLTATREAESGVSFSPDGKRVAFIRGGRLWTMAPDGKDARVLVSEVQVFDYEWSPDSRWVVFARRDGSFASELYIVPAGGATAADPIRNITRYATYNGGVTWSGDGKKLAFLSDRRADARLHVMELEKPAASTATPTPTRSSFGMTAKAPVTIDWDDIHLRVQPVLRGLVEEAAISPDGSKVAYRDGTTRDLWVGSASGGQLTRLTTGGVAPRQLHWSKRRTALGGSMEVLYFLDGQGTVRLCNTAGGEPKAGSSNLATVPFKVRLTVRQDEQFTEMFEQTWRFLADHFYDEKFHGHNWDAVRQRYRPLLRHVAMKEDLYALLYLMLGELNASHLGVQGTTSGPEEETAELGLLWDEAYRGKGLKIREVVKRGTADRKGIALRPGDVVTAIDDVALTASTNLAQLLNGKVGEPVALTVTDNPADAKATRRRVEVTGMARGQTAGQKTPSLGELMYDRWVARNAARVAELSGGKLGYIHIPSMNEDGLDRFVRALYSDNFDKEAIVLDVRFNGGGFTHDQVLNYLGSREHTIFRNRHGGQGLVLRSSDRKWTRPLVLLINNRSFSDAEIFPNAFRTLGLGKLVGEPTGGFVIGTTAVRLIDGSQLRLPQIGVYTTRGVNMEKEGVVPDVLVENHPDDLARGVDAQLDRAVELLKNSPQRTQRGTEGKPEKTGTEKN
ncbi:MAG: S41 family peptidase [Gemmataceae bacterium]